jgi:hypothetical protein
MTGIHYKVNLSSTRVGPLHGSRVVPRYHVTDLQKFVQAMSLGKLVCARYNKSTETRNTSNCHRALKSRHSTTVPLMRPRPGPPRSTSLLTPYRAVPLLLLSPFLQLHASPVISQSPTRPPSQTLPSSTLIPYCCTLYMYTLNPASIFHLSQPARAVCLYRRSFISMRQAF